MASARAINVKPNPREQLTASLKAVAVKGTTAGGPEKLALKGVPASLWSRGARGGAGQKELNIKAWT
ncbi:MAG: hypothetical protein LBJ64_05905 [Deltaproteobacteria bacterium]|nr:hypothetical protein [Deltaproteobacteria bacterium]